MPEEKSCPFCLMEETQGERILERREHLYVILSNPYLVPCHTLIIPRVHVATIAELYWQHKEVLAEVVESVAIWTERLKTVLSKAWGKNVGCDNTQHDRSFLTLNGISVPDHFHYHIQPRTLNDELYQQVQIHETPMFCSQRLNWLEIEERKVLLGCE